MSTKQTFIIAEFAQGFEGNPNYAKLLVKAAADSGADAAKFQLIYADELATPEYKYYTLFKSLEMHDEEWISIADTAKNNGIALQLDIFGERSLLLAEHLNVDAVKIHGTDIANKRLLTLVSQTKIKRIILGVGGALQSEIKFALELLSNKEVIILFGFQSYPTPIEDNHVSRIKIAKALFSSLYPTLKIGFADHADPTTNMHLGIAAIAIGMGAEVVEKHLTLARIMKMEDFESAINPDEFIEYVHFIRGCEKSIGNATLEENFNMSQSEVDYRKMIRRHVVTIKSLQKGNILSADNLVLKRTASETFNTDINEVVGKVALDNIDANNPVEIKHIFNEK